MKHISLALAGLAAFAVIAVGAQASATSGKTLIGTTGPGFTITVKTTSGTRVRRIKAGRYTFKIHDKSSIHNFHLIGPGVNKKTTVSFVGTKIWRVKLTKGTYRYRCDIHFRLGMKGSFKVT